MQARQKEGIFCSSWRLLWTTLTALLVLATTKQPTAEPEAFSLFGEPLYRIELAPERKDKLEAELAEAKSDYERDTSDPERVIWLGRRLAYLWRYREAIEVYSKGIEIRPRYAKLYRHRGHRYITVRQFDKAIEDLEKAAALIEGVKEELEPDGAPNQAGKPRSTSHFNIWYHLGLAYYLKGDFENAVPSYLACMNFSKLNDDLQVATADWLYMTYRRLDRDKEAAAVAALIDPNMDILENFSYHKRLLMYQGLIRPESLLDSANLAELDLATRGYGVANWYFCNGDKARAKQILEKLVQGKHWAAFGYIAAEADLKRWAEEGQ
jgi:tetratricopeptide (TPR) repeat protein